MKNCESCSKCQTIKITGDGKFEENPDCFGYQASQEDVMNFDTLPERKPIDLEKLYQSAGSDLTFGGYIHFSGSCYTLYQKSMEEGTNIPLAFNGDEFEPVLSNANSSEKPNTVVLRKCNGGNLLYLSQAEYEAAF